MATSALVKMKKEREKVLSKREEALGLMTSALRREARAAERRLGEARKSTVMACYDLGVVVQRVRDGGAEYGDGAVEELADYLGVPANYLYRLGALADAFARAQVQEWAGRPMADGGRLSVHHLLSVMNVARAAERPKLVERALDQSLSVRELAHEIFGNRLAKVKTSQGGRPVKPPKSVAAGLGKAIGDCRALTKWLPGFYDVVLLPLQQTPPADVNPAVRGQLAEALNAVADLENALVGTREEAEAALAQVDRALAAQAELASTIRAAQVRADEVFGRRGELPMEKANRDERVAGEVWAAWAERDEQGGPSGSPRQLALPPPADGVDHASDDGEEGGVVDGAEVGSADTASAANEPADGDDEGDEDNNDAAAAGTTTAPGPTPSVSRTAASGRRRAAAGSAREPAVKPAVKPARANVRARRAVAASSFWDE